MAFDLRVFQTSRAHPRQVGHNVLCDLGWFRESPPSLSRVLDVDDHRVFLSCLAMTR